eukprot:7930507-Pyramimonas_sp.AAC.2
MKWGALNGPELPRPRDNNRPCRVPHEHASHVRRVRRQLRLPVRSIDPPYDEQNGAAHSAELIFLISCSFHHMVMAQIRFQLSVILPRNTIHNQGRRGGKFRTGSGPLRCSFDS